MRKPLYIMIHHSLTPDGDTVSWNAIEAFHRSWRFEGRSITQEEASAKIHAGIKGVEAPWKDIGYHAGVERIDGKIDALLGRDWSTDAAACPQGGMNTLAMHACVVGNFDLAPPDAQLIQVLVERVVRPWMHMYEIPSDHIVGHHDYNPHKTCPGTRFDLNFLRGLVR